MRSLEAIPRCTKRSSQQGEGHDLFAYEPLLALASSTGGSAKLMARVWATCGAIVHQKELFG